MNIEETFAYKNLVAILTEHKTHVEYPKFSISHLTAAVDATIAKNIHHGYKTPEGMYSEKGLYKAASSEGRQAKKSIKKNDDKGAVAHAITAASIANMLKRRK